MSSHAEPWSRLWSGLALGLLLVAAPARAAPDAAALYAAHCAECHGADRLGAMGPALAPENLGRLKPAEAAGVIAAGRPLTRMPGFADRLDSEAVRALVGLIYTPLPQMPQWGEAEMIASRTVAVAPGDLVDKPVFDADMLDLFIVVEQGDSHVTVLDGTRFEPIHRFPSRFALHGGPKFSPDGRFVYFASRDGWITKFDLWGLVVVAELRAGINTRNLAISGDGKVVAVANTLPHTLVLLDAADLSPLKVIPARDATGKISSRVSAVYQAAPRNAFIVALKDAPELWEISWLENPPPVYAGLVHNYDKDLREGLAETGRFPVRRIALGQPLDDFFFDPAYRQLLGSARGGKALVVQLDVGREIAEIPITGLPHLGSGIVFERDGRQLIATPNLAEAKVSVIDTKGWRLAATIDTLGPGFFIRSHENTPYAWVDNSFSRHRDTLQIIDKRSLEVVRAITPAPGKTASHVEFSRDGRHALVSIAENDGWLVVYDAASLEEVKRLPMRKPSGKYNIHNKITRSTGTSH